MKNVFIIRYGDVTLKGKNKKSFIDRLVEHIKKRLHSYPITYHHAHNRLYLTIQPGDYTAIKKDLQTVPGIHSFSLAQQTTLEENAILAAANDEIASYPKPLSFKVKTKRADKNFPIPSMVFSRKIAGHLLINHPDLTVDVHHPDCLLEIEIRPDKALIFSRKIAALGGFPSGTLGRGYLLLSGGIDSPVAGFLAMKQGIEIEAYHFHSTPLTSIESVQKVIDISKQLARFSPKHQLTLHLISFTEMHQAILNTVPEPYHITIMRRMMLRFLETAAERNHVPGIITGESVGQVASQTLESMKVINAVTNRPILRPLTTYDKQQIIELARTIDTYSIAIRPFEDCCSIYVPKHPTTDPRVFYALRYERLFDYQSLLKTMTQSMHTLIIKPESQLDLPRLGFTVEEALKGGNHDYQRGQ